MTNRASTPTAEALLEHAGFLRGLARSLVFDEGQADDVVQETMIAALGRAPRHRSRLRAWLAGIAKNLALKSLRAEGRRVRRERRAARDDALAPTDEIAARLELQRRVVEAVQELHEPYRSAVVYRYFEERRPGEIARDLGVPVKTVETRLRRAIARLRVRLDAALDGDRRAWCLGLVAVLPLSRPAAAAGLPTLATTTLAGALMTKTAYLVTAALLVASFFAGWGLKAETSSQSKPARAGRTAVDPETEAELKRLRGELALLKQPKRQGAAATAEDPAAGAAPQAEDSTEVEGVRGPRFVFADQEGVLREIDWDKVGEALHEMPPVLAEFLKAIEETGEIPANAGELQRLNGPLVTAALQLMNAGVTGTGINGAFTHPAAAANMIHAALLKSDRPLTREQEDLLEDLGRRFVAEESMRNAAYGEDSLALRRMVDEAALKDRLFGEVDKLLGPEQRALLRPDGTRGYTQVDLFSSGVFLYPSARPVPFKDRESLVKQVTDRHLQTFGFDASARPVVEGLVRRWAERVVEEGLDAPRERTIAAMPLMMKTDRVRKAAELQLELWEALGSRLSLTDEQKKKLREETKIIVPYGAG